MANDSNAEIAINTDPKMYTDLIPNLSAIKPISAIEQLVMVDKTILLEAYTFVKTALSTLV
ncbi:hypothetical protein [Bacillus sp. AFS055030]|uniref:hypothetical protein n=1 Tax=Bacillus sp. AFS055030 TaxID=2033507 RepID=UPI000BFE763D|nr:hypothetical protein [Bacillus sp. AFS055030]PGL71175.1 hypothetical protein CN925_09995 [Bacillus sp. AFS055030]